MMESATGKDVLCLASGGGHQSAEFGLLGANVTVLDISAGQLGLDARMAEHYGYALKIVQADMRDLSAFAPASFDRVVQGVGLCFVPDVREVYREVTRVLRPGGLYSAVHENPFTYPADFAGPDNGWDGKGYRITEPYLGGPIRKASDGRDTMGDGEFTGEFRHLLSDVFNGLIESGLSLFRVGGDSAGDRLAEPGSRAHMQAVVPQYFCTIAQRSRGD
jgi:SAM-dependent methyltransferase